MRRVKVGLQFCRQRSTRLKVKLLNWLSSLQNSKLKGLPHTAETLPLKRCLSFRSYKEMTSLGDQVAAAVFHQITRRQMHPFRQSLHKTLGLTPSTCPLMWTPWREGWGASNCRLQRHVFPQFSWKIWSLLTLLGCGKTTSAGIVAIHLFS